MKKGTHTIFLKLITIIGLGIFCAFFAMILKTLAEGSERFLLQFIQAKFIGLLVLAPLVGLLLVAGVKRVFNIQINGLRDIINSQREPLQILKPVKVVVHFFTGFFTIVFGGSTGIEVSAVVASAAGGSFAGSNKSFSEKFRKHLIVAGAAAGIAGLFSSPLAGIFFAIEVLMIGFSWELIGISALAAFTAFGVRYLLNGDSLFHPLLNGWRWQALQYYAVLALISSLCSVFLTLGVIRSKSFFNSRFGEQPKVLAGGILLGIIIILLVPMYGEGYAFIEDLLTNHTSSFTVFNNSGIGLLLLLLIVKPIATSLTLASGGDGGVFAPSLFMGAVAGFLLAHSINYFGGSVIAINFTIVGMAAILSASLHAPLTATFLVMSITGGYELFIPMVMSSCLSSYLAKKMFPFTVYSY